MAFGDPVALRITMHFHREPRQPFSLVKGCLQLVNQHISHHQMFAGKLSKQGGNVAFHVARREDAPGTEAESSLQARGACSPRATIQDATVPGEGTGHLEPQKKMEEK